MFEKKEIITPLLIPTNPELVILSNPLKNKKLQLRVQGYRAGKYQLEILTANGQQIYHQGISVQTPAMQINVPLQQVKAGTYILVFVNEYGKRETRRFMIAD